MFSQVSFLITIKWKQSKHLVTEKQINNQGIATVRKYLGSTLKHEANTYELMWTTCDQHK